MRSPVTLRRISVFTTMFLAVQLAHGPVRACEDASQASQAPLALTGTADEPRSDAGTHYAQLKQEVSDKVELVTGDGQQATVSTNGAACVTPNAGCTL